MARGVSLKRSARSGISTITNNGECSQYTPDIRPYSSIIRP